MSIHNKQHHIQVLSLTLTLLIHNKHVFIRKFHRWVHRDRTGVRSGVRCHCRTPPKTPDVGDAICWTPLKPWCGVVRFVVNRSTGTEDRHPEGDRDLVFQKDQKWQTLTRRTRVGRGLVRTDQLKVRVMIDSEVVDSYASVESFCVCRTGTIKTQSWHDLKTPKE